MNKLKLFSIVGIVAIVLTACGGGAAATTAPAATSAPAATAASGATAAAPAANIPDVPRNQTVILGWSISSPIGVTNPWAVPGYTHQEGNVFMWEPLAY